MKEKFLLTLVSLAVVVFAVPADASFAVVLGSNGVYAYVDEGYTPLEKVEQMAIDLCQKEGGVNIRIVGAGIHNGYWELPEAGPRYQLINGDLFMAPAPNRFHQDISRTIQFEIMKYLEAEPVGILYDAPFDVVLTDINVFQPDLAFFSERRRRFLTDKGAEGAPDLVVEILSPKTAHLDLEQKRLVYARTGVDELWVVDPEGEEVRVYLFREDPDLPKVILRSGDLLKTSRLPGFELSIQKIFERF